ncbi:hypothetical protein Ccr2_gp087 [Caulobacter phage Ccr2]|nr:hypothetical protein Ccr10_gp088 [Caulobacter phage Ccr10]ARB13962.1 hypothetical protein Ccr2_gp087 [Caulobacter phage Ccr2]
MIPALIILPRVYLAAWLSFWLGED